MSLLDSWTRGEHTAPVAGTPTTHPTYRKGSGPGVIVIHEIPGLSPADLETVRARAAAGCEVLGLRYRKDPAVGTRFETLTREIGDRFLRVELDGKGHSTVTAHRSQEAVDDVLAFFREKLAAHA